MDSASGMILDMELVHVSETDGKLAFWEERFFMLLQERKKKGGGGAFFKLVF